MSSVRRLLVSLIVATAGAGAIGADAWATGRGNEDVTFAGGSQHARAQVVSALSVSEFDWSPIVEQVTVHIGRFDSAATPGHVWLNADLMRTGRFSWGVVLHEFAHQVDFLLLRPEDRDLLRSHLGGEEWFPAGAVRPHDGFSCERFASTFAWSYWQSPANSMKPSGPGDESGAMSPRAFRRLLADVLSDGDRDPEAQDSAAVLPFEIA